MAGEQQRCVASTRRDRHLDERRRSVVGDVGGPVSGEPELAQSHRYSDVGGLR